MCTLTVLRIAVVFLLCSYTNEAATHSKLHGKYWSQFKEVQDLSGVSSKTRIEHILDQITPMSDDVRDWGSNAETHQNTYRKYIICDGKPGPCPRGAKKQKMDNPHIWIK